MAPGASRLLIDTGDDAGVDVTTWYLEQTGPDQLRRPAAPAENVDIVRAEIPSPEFSRFLYTSVGGDWFWMGRLAWTWKQWKDWVDRPGVETWVAWIRGTPAGYGEIDAQPGGHVEITCFGLFPSFIGRGLGGHLLAEVLQQAWSLADRRRDRDATERVWVHTCSLDGKSALPNYKARGMRVYQSKTESEVLPETPPGPWPGARSAP